MSQATTDAEKLADVRTSLQSLFNSGTAYDPRNHTSIAFSKMVLNSSIKLIDEVSDSISTARSGHTAHTAPNSQSLPNSALLSNTSYIDFILMHMLVYGVGCFYALLALVFTVYILLACWTYPDTPLDTFLFDANLYQPVGKPMTPQVLQRLEFEMSFIAKLVLMAIYPWTIGTLVYRLHRKGLNSQNGGEQAAQISSPDQAVATTSNEGDAGDDDDENSSDGNSEDSVVRLNRETHECLPY